jgi:hypothetical protein
MQLSFHRIPIYKCTITVESKVCNAKSYRRLCNRCLPCSREEELVSARLDESCPPIASWPRVFSKWFNQIFLEFKILTQIPYLKSKDRIKFIQIPSLNRIWKDSNLNWIWIILKKNGNVRCFSGLHGSPHPQWPTGPRPSKLAHSGGLRPAHGAQGTSRARPAHVARLRVIGDKVFTSTICTALATSCYTKT